MKPLFYLYISISVISVILLEVEEKPYKSTA